MGFRVGVLPLDLLVVDGVHRLGQVGVDEVGRGCVRGGPFPPFAFVPRWLRLHGRPLLYGRTDDGRSRSGNWHWEREVDLMREEPSEEDLELVWGKSSEGQVNRSRRESDIKAETPTFFR